MTAEREESIAQLPLPGGLSFQSGTGYLLGKVGAVARQRWTATLAQTGVSPNQFLVLMALAETGRVCQQFLAGVIGIDPRNIVPILDSLEARGLVSRETDPADRRRRLIELTGAACASSRSCPRWARRPSASCWRPCRRPTRSACAASCVPCWMRPGRQADDQAARLITW